MDTQTYGWLNASNSEMNTLKPQYPQDDGPISDEYFLFLTEHAKSLLPTGKIISSESFFEKSGDSSLDDADKSQILPSNSD
jgi:hypothetical protein